MPNFNKVILIGHLTRDPELNYTQNGSAVCNCRIGVNHKYGDREEECFTDLTIWGKMAEIFTEYQSKGSAVLVEGRLCLDQWETQEGQKRSKHYITVEKFTFLPKSGDGGGSQGGGNKRWKPEDSQKHRESQAQREVASDDEIPF